MGASEIPVSPVRVPPFLLMVLPAYMLVTQHGGCISPCATIGSGEPQDNETSREQIRKSITVELNEVYNALKISPSSDTPCLKTIF